jgi:UDP-2-acetamido-3-amino-2,3-dideoxy-glucuronate N-acetyltransferase
MSDQVVSASGLPRVALIGCGRWGRNIARVLARLGALEVIVDPAADLLAGYAAELGVRVTADLDAAFAHGIDGVAIAVPAADHARVVLQALDAGKHVYVEKPLALELDDAEACAARADSVGKTLMIGHLLQYHPAFLALKEAVVRGDIGELRHITSNRLNPGAIRTEETALWSMAPHDFSMILGLTGAAPESVASLPVQVIPGSIPDQYHVQMRFPGGVTSNVSVSWLSPFKEHKLVVLGTTGAIVFEDTQPERERKLLLYRDYIDRSSGAARFVKSEAVPVDFAEGEPLENEMRTFLHCASTGEIPPTGAHEAIPVLQLLMRAS